MVYSFYYYTPPSDFVVMFSKSEFCMIKELILLNERMGFEPMTNDALFPATAILFKYSQDWSELSKPPEKVNNDNCVNVKVAN